MTQVVYKTVLMLFALGAASLAHALQVPGPLVDNERLDKHKDRVTILDVRADLKSFVQKPAYVKDKKSGDIFLRRVAGHIPGAHLVD